MSGVAFGAAAVAVMIGLIARWGTAVEFIVGALVVVGPNLWVATRGFRSAHVGGAIALALSKYVLAGLGFAAWFALRPNSDATAVLAGSAVALLAIPIAVYFVAKQKQ